MLKITDIKGGYSKGSLVLKGVSLEISRGETLGIIGLNGCGKSTLGKAIFNEIPFREGKVMLDGSDISGLPSWKIRNKGVGLFLQGGRVFRNMSVMEHLLLAGAEKEKNVFKKRLEYLRKYIPLLTFTSNNTEHRKAGLLSGGERQQLALAMVLIPQPKVLILDEPSAGLSPVAAFSLAEMVTTITQEEQMATLLIEQNLQLATMHSNKIHWLNQGIIEKTFDTKSQDVLTEINQTIFNT